MPCSGGTDSASEHIGSGSVRSSSRPCLGHKHMVLFTPGEAETRCKLEDKEDCELVFAMAKARAFSGTGVHYYDVDASVEEIDCLQRTGPELMHLQA